MYKVVLGLERVPCPGWSSKWCLVRGCSCLLNIYVISHLYKHTDICDIGECK